MYINLLRDEDGLKFQLFDDQKELFFTSQAFKNPDDCNAVLQKLKENHKFVEWLPTINAFH